MVTAADALDRLREGNERFASNASDIVKLVSPARREQLLAAQNPFAIVLGCSDSRVPAEIVFDQGLGDLFVIRVAGNIVAPSLLGSIEFSARLHGVRLVLVLGHTQCGAIQATLDELEQPSGDRSPNLSSIVNRIRPSVETLRESGLGGDRDTLVRHATRANIRQSTAHIRNGSRVIEELIAHDGLRVVGAEYSLESGLVDFFDDDMAESWTGGGRALSAARTGSRRARAARFAVRLCLSRRADGGGRAVSVRSSGSSRSRAGLGLEPFRTRLGEGGRYDSLQSIGCRGPSGWRTCRRRSVGEGRPADGPGTGAGAHRGVTGRISGRKTVLQDSCGAVFLHLSSDKSVTWLGPSPSGPTPPPVSGVARRRGRCRDRRR